MSNGLHGLCRKVYTETNSVPQTCTHFFDCSSLNTSHEHGHWMIETYTQTQFNAATNEMPNFYNLECMIFDFTAIRLLQRNKKEKYSILRQSFCLFCVLVLFYFILLQESNLSTNRKNSKFPRNNVKSSWSVQQNKTRKSFNFVIVLVFFLFCVYGWFVSEPSNVQIIFRLPSVAPLRR